jgi:hypothetical protein
MYANAARECTHSDYARGLSQGIFNLINSRRVREGQPAIAYSSECQSVCDMKTKDAYNHYTTRDKARFTYDTIGSLKSHAMSGLDGAPLVSECGEMTSVGRRAFGMGGETYECVITANYRLTAEDAMRIWEASPAHFDTLMNRGTWCNHSFDGMAVGVCALRASARGIGRPGEYTVLVTAWMFEKDQEHPSEALYQHWRDNEGFDVDSWANRGNFNNYY